MIQMPENVSPRDNVALRIDSLKVRLLKLEETVSFLRQLVPTNISALKENARDMMAVERGLQLGAESIIAIGSHILSAHYGTSAADYEDIMKQLTLRGVVSAKLRDRLTGLGGFRNLLVHGYTQLDPERVLDRLMKAPRDSDDFMREIRAWLDALPQ